MCVPMVPAPWHRYITTSGSIFPRRIINSKVGADGLYQISESVLTAAGLSGTADAASFQLWRNGVQVPIYTSVPSGMMPAGGYIEFYGKANDGAPDNPVYLQPTFQISKHWSLFTDTAVYFLTVNPGGGNLRVYDTPNNLAANHLAPGTLFYVPQCQCTSKADLDNGVYLTVEGNYIISSSYDAGEGYINGVGYWPGSPYSYTFSGLPVYAAGPGSSVSVGVNNLVFDNRVMELSYNNRQASTKS